MEFGSGLMHCTVAQVAGPLRLPDPSHPQFVVCSSSVDPGRTAAHLNIFGIEALHPCLRLGVQRGATVPSVCRASPLDNSMASRAGAVREGKGREPVRVLIMIKNLRLGDQLEAQRNPLSNRFLVAVSRQCKLKNGIYSKRSLYR